MRRAAPVAAAAVVAVAVLAVPAGSAAPLRAGPAADLQEAGEGGAGSEVRLLVPEGSLLRLVLRDTVSTRSSEVGDRFEARLSEALRVDGRIAVPAGATVRGRVTTVRGSGNMGETAVLHMDVQSIRVGDEWLPLRASIAATGAVQESRWAMGWKLLLVGLLALAGGIVGRYAGSGDTRVLVGAALGAVVGVVAVTLFHDVDVILPAGSELTLRLEQALEVRRAASP